MKYVITFLEKLNILPSDVFYRTSRPGIKTPRILKCVLMLWQAQRGQN